MFKAIDNKKVNMTTEEYNEYIQICRSYDRPSFKGEELFKNLFETNDDGMIVYIKSLGNKQISLEVLFFITNLMQNQWLRAMASRANETFRACREKFDEKIAELDLKIAELDKKANKTK